MRRLSGLLLAGAILLLPAFSQGDGGARAQEPQGDGEQEKKGRHEPERAGRAYPGDGSYAQLRDQPQPPDKKRLPG